MRAFAKYRGLSRRLLCERPIAVLLTLFLCAATVIVWRTYSEQSKLVATQALQDARRLSSALAEFRSIYTSEVVERVRPQGITVAHDYEHKEGAIPLPATLSIMLGNRIGDHAKTQTRLYSPFPFPWRRANGGLSDDFARDAWEFLTKNPDTPFYRFEEYGGVPVLRYATADVMRAPCVGCHNTHPDSPKTDWKVGDVRGVLEVIASLDVPLGESRSGLVDTTVLLLLLTVGGLLLTGIVLGHLRQAVNDAQTSSKRALDAVADGVIMIDQAGIVQSLNPAAETIFGYHAGDVVGRNVKMLMPDEFARTHDGHVARHVETNVSTVIGDRRDLLGRRKDGSIFPMDLTVTDAKIAGRSRVFIGILRDITETKRAETALISRRDQLEEMVARRTAELKKQSDQLEQALATEKELNALQRQFVSMASHELRTPLAIIDGTAQRMMRRQGHLTPDDVQQRTGKIRRAVKRMITLIDSTLSVARLDAGRITLSAETMDLASAIATVCQRQQEISSKHKISVNVGGITAPIFADPALLDQVFTNLLSNAVKYSPDDSAIEVRGWMEGDQVVVSVRDHGLGIPEHDLPRLFERFFRAGTSTGIPGTGIGLDLARQLVKMHDGSIEVESLEGEGSTFTVRLPVRQAGDGETPGQSGQDSPVAA